MLVPREVETDCGHCWFLCAKARVARAEFLRPRDAMVLYCHIPGSTSTVTVMIGPMRIMLNPQRSMSLVRVPRWASSALAMQVAPGDENGVLSTRFEEIASAMIRPKAGRPVDADQRNGQRDQRTEQSGGRGEGRNERGHNA